MAPFVRQSFEGWKERDWEIGLKRARGELSCAECRRLKLRCDKKLPCSTCVRRGCSTICPNGCLSTGEGSKSIPVGPEALRHKLLKMSKRISQLEDALQISHSTYCTTEHPLLSEDLLEVKSGIDTPDPDDQEVESENEVLDGDILGSFRTLAVADREETLIARLMGPATMLPATLEDRQLTDSQPDDANPLGQLPVQISQLSCSFPFAPVYLPTLEIQELIGTYLPSYERASALCEAYLENISWLFRPIDREQIMEELIPSVYKKWLGRPPTSRKSPIVESAYRNKGEEREVADAHELAALLMVLAVGAAADLTLTPQNDEAELYYQLSRATLSLKSMFECCSLATVQAVALMGVYDLFSPQVNPLGRTNNMINFIMSLASGLNLHRDPARLGLEPKMVQRRRRLFWELCVIDNWRSIESGRPATFTANNINCEFPIDTDATLDEDGTEVPSPWRWKYRYLREVLTGIAETLGSAKSLKYSEIMELDRRVREFGPEQLFKRVTSAIGDDGIRANLQRCMMSVLKDVSLLFIHHNFFARAMLEDTINPLCSKFAPSFLSAYRSATTLIKVIRESLDATSALLHRLWPVWSHIFTASIIMGSVAARGASFALAPHALSTLDLAIELFEKAPSHPVVKIGLPILLRLQHKARHIAHGNLIDHEPRRGTVVMPPLSGGKHDSIGSSLHSGSPRQPSTPQSVQILPLNSAVDPRVAVLPSAASTALGANAPYATAHAGDTGIATPPFPTTRYDTYNVALQNTGMQGGAGTDPSFQMSNPTLQQFDFSPLASTRLNGLTQNFFDTTGLPTFGDSEHRDSSLPRIYPDFIHPAFPVENLPEISPSMMMNVDFDISADMRAGVEKDSLLPLRMDEDQTIADAWHAIMRDTRFFDQ